MVVLAHFLSHRVVSELTLSNKRKELEAIKKEGSSGDTLEKEIEDLNRKNKEKAELEEKRQNEEFEALMSELAELKLLVENTKTQAKKTETMKEFNVKLVFLS